MSNTEDTQAIAASKSGMDVKTARKYLRAQRLPSELKTDRHWRTRQDEFAEVWPGIVEQIRTNPGLEAKTIFAALQRRIKRWRASEGPAQEVYFVQEHRAGELCESDFTHMTKQRESLSYERYLHELIQRECEERQENRIVKMLRESQLPLEKTLDAFDTKRLPAKAARQMRSLLDGGFLGRNENVLVFGNPGSGKTHMLQAISQELVRQGRRMLFTTCEMLVQDLLIAKRDLKP